MARLLLPLLLPSLLLAACSKTNDIYEELPNSSLAGAPREDVPETRLETRLSRPVTIGEDGPQLDACGTLGRATRVGAAGLAVRAAPFAEAKVVARLGEDARAYVCTRSLDQKWLGIVIPPAPAPDLPVDNAAAAALPDCGVTGPVDRKQPYAGACASGWVASAQLRLIAG